MRCLEKVQTCYSPFLNKTHVPLTELICYSLLHCPSGQRPIKTWRPPRLCSKKTRWQMDQVSILSALPPPVSCYHTSDLMIITIIIISLLNPLVVYNTKLQGRSRIRRTHNYTLRFPPIEPDSWVTLPTPEMHILKWATQGYNKPEGAVSKRIFSTLQAQPQFGLKIRGGPRPPRLFP